MKNKKDLKGGWTVEKHREIQKRIKDKDIASMYKKINWQVFFDNSSTTDALIDFIDGYSFNRSVENIKWPKEVVEQFPKIKQLIKNMGVSYTRQLARQALTRGGYLLI